MVGSQHSHLPGTLLGGPGWNNKIHRVTLWKAVSLHNLVGMGSVSMRLREPAILGSFMLTGGTMLMVLSVYFDAWWHESVGRESFWIPPHLGIYAGLLVSITGFLDLYRLHSGKIPRELWLYLGGIAGVVVSGYADELWHQRFGIEKLGTLDSVWSPPHVSALASGGLVALGIIFYLLAQIRIKHGFDASFRWLLVAEFGVLVSVITLLLLPLGPESPFRVIGVWGAPLIAFPILALRFLGSALSEKPWALTLITSFNWSGNIVLLLNHASPVLLLTFLAVGLVPPFLADLLVQRGRRLKDMRTAYTLVGIVWGVIFGALFYPLTNSLSFSYEFPALDYASLAIAGVTSAAASILAGYLVGLRSQRLMLARTFLPVGDRVLAGART